MIRFVWIKYFRKPAFLAHPFLPVFCWNWNYIYYSSYSNFGGLVRNCLLPTNLTHWRTALNLLRFLSSFRIKISGRFFVPNQLFYNSFSGFVLQRWMGGWFFFGWEEGFLFALNGRLRGWWGAHNKWGIILMSIKWQWRSRRLYSPNCPSVGRMGWGGRNKTIN